MSQANYTAIQKMRLIDLHTLPSNLLLQWLASKPAWLQAAVIGRQAH